jgi:YD repeat-containing protein
MKVDPNASNASRANASRAGNSVTNWFNNQGLLCVVSNAFGCQRLTTYDLEDHGTNMVDANTITNKYTYDALGRVSKRTDGNNKNETFGYNSLGLIAHTNQLNHTNFYTYDVAGRKTAETNANREIIQYTYNAAGDLLKLRDGKSQETKWGYDQYGRVTSKTNQAGTEILRYQYDANGRLTNRWSLAKGNTRYVYDADGNLTLIDYPTSPDITMQYDANNRLTNMIDAVGTTRYTYTDFGALLSEDGPWDSDTVSYGYTTNRLRSGLHLLQPNASDWDVSYGYDKADRLTSVTSPAGTFSCQYDPMCHLLVNKLSLPNSAYITNTFDALGRLTGTYLKNSSHNLLNAHEYALDETSRRTNQVRIVTGTNVTSAPITNSVAYTYDRIGQLKTAFGKESGGSTNRVHERFGYAYDDANNLSYRTNNIFRHTFTCDNQLTSITRSGTYTVAGTTWGSATNVTVAANGGAATAAIRYADATFARTNITLLNGTNTFTAVAQDEKGRADTNTIKAYLPSTVSFKYDGNGNMRTNGTRIFDYDDENQLIAITEPNA